MTLITVFLVLGVPVNFRCILCHRKAYHSDMGVITDQHQQLITHTLIDHINYGNQIKCLIKSHLYSTLHTHTHTPTHSVHSVTQLNHALIKMHYTNFELFLRRTIKPST